MRHGSLFSGLGGFDLAARWVGWENAFHSEIDPFCLTILKHHFPDAITYTDIRNTDFTPWRDKIDVLSGGFPCQPFSQAGKRKGTSDDRHLWPEMLRAIREIRPHWVVGENVLGITNWDGGVVFEQVCADLETEGYSVQPTVLPACGVNAPHQRYRTWFVAHRNDDELFAGLPLPEQIWTALASDGGAVADPDGDRDRMPEPGGFAAAQGDEESLGTEDGSTGEPCRTDTLGNERRHSHGYVSDNTGGYAGVRYLRETSTDPDGGQCQMWNLERSGMRGQDRPKDCSGANDRVARYGDVGIVADSDGIRPEDVPPGSNGQDYHPRQRGDIHSRTANDGSERIASDATSARLEGEVDCGKQKGARTNNDIREVAPGCRIGNAADSSRFSSQDHRIDTSSVGKTDCGQTAGGSEYGDLSKDWLDFPTVPPVCRGDDGLAEILHGISFPRWRKESIKAYGNAIVPQIAYRIFRVIEFMSNGR